MNIFPRLGVLFTLLVFSPSMPAAESGDFVQVRGRQFTLAGQPWYVCGANLWYGVSLGRPSNPEGRKRLVRELDRLEKLGVNNLRVLGAAEDCAVAGTLKPAITLSPGEYNEDMLQGFDFLVAEAGRRKMKLVVFLNNYWDWSGGIPQYLAWATHQPAKGLADLSWKEWNRLQSSFFTNPAAQALPRQYIAMLLDRTNTLTGTKYRDEPAIMTWELANEPRAGEREGEEKAVFAAFLAWVESTSAFIHSLDSHHLVTTGSEGTMGCLSSAENFRRIHAVKTIDYAVFHLWPKNWKWFEVDRHQATLEATLAKSAAYVKQHLALAEALNKPMVVEEFGLDRDGGVSVSTPTASRDQLYAEVYRLLEDSVAAGGSAAGSNFWLWGGEGRPPKSGDGPPVDGIGAGDMLQEPPGLNTVFDCDTSTLALLSGHFAKLHRFGETGHF